MFLKCQRHPASTREPNTTINRTNCGSCDQACHTFPNATSACQNSQCGIGSCNAGYANCNGLLADGCEINTTNNVNNCGTCGNVCGPIANGTPSCSSSTCTPVCNSGFGNCNGTYGDGCEVNFSNDHNNCGFCGHVCGPMTVCQSGQCFIP